MILGSSLCVGCDAWSSKFHLATRGYLCGIWRCNVHRVERLCGNLGHMMMFKENWQIFMWLTLNSIVIQSPLSPGCKLTLVPLQSNLHVVCDARSFKFHVATRGYFSGNYPLVQCLLIWNVCVEIWVTWWCKSAREIDKFPCSYALIDIYLCFPYVVASFGAPRVESRVHPNSMCRDMDIFLESDSAMCTYIKG